MNFDINSLPTAPDYKPQVFDWADFKERISGKLQQGIYSGISRYGLRRDLRQPIERPEAKVPITVRPLADGDMDVLLPMEGETFAAEAGEIIARRNFYKKFPDSCFVAVDMRDNTPCYMQWLIGAKHNDALARFKCFPRLEADEALLEHAYTPPSHRGLRIMAAAMARVAECANDIGAHKVITFVGVNNIPSLKGCQRAGFRPYLMHRGDQLGFGIIARNTFRELASNDPRRTKTF